MAALRGELRRLRHALETGAASPREQAANLGGGCSPGKPGGAEEDDYFRDGMTEDIITELPDRESPGLSAGGGGRLPRQAGDGPRGRSQLHATHVLRQPPARRPEAAGHGPDGRKPDGSIRLAERYDRR